MAFPVQTETLSDGLRSAVNRAASLKNYCIGARAAMAAGDYSSDNILLLLRNLKACLDTWAIVKALPSIDVYAQEQLGDPNLDIAAEFAAMEAATVSARDWIVANFPKSAGGFIEREIINADGSITERSFSVAQTAGLRTELDAVIATIG